MEENKNGKTKSVSIVLILLAVVIGFGFLFGLAQVAGGKKDNLSPDLNPEISNYYFDEEGRFLTYFNSEKSWGLDINIPRTYSLTPTKVDMQMEAGSISELTNFATKIKLKTFTITDISGYVKNGNYEENNHWNRLYNNNHWQKLICKLIKCKNNYNAKHCQNG